MQHFSKVSSSTSTENLPVNAAINPEMDSSLALALTAIRAADDRKGGDITLLRVTEVSLLADYFVIVTGYSKAQVRAIVNAIADRVEEEVQRAPLHTEGMAEASWVLQDYGDVIVHVLMPHEREFYDLEAFWGHAERVAFQPMLEPVKALS